MNKYLIIKILLPVVFFALVSNTAGAQRRRNRKAPPPVAVADTVPYYKPAINRVVLHENIDKEQQLLLTNGSRVNGKFNISNDDAVNRAAADAVTKRVDWLQYEIETGAAYDQRLKANYLAGLAKILAYLRTNMRYANVNAAYLPEMIDTYKKAIALDAQKKSVAGLLAPLPYDVANTVVRLDFFKDNPGYNEIRDVMLLKLANTYPAKTMAALKNYPDASFADSLIKILAHRYPQQLYDYAQANNKLSYRIQNIEGDPLISAIVSMARSDTRSGQFYFPFLDNIVHNKITIEEINKVKDNPVLYFRLLVNTQMDYAARAAAGDTAIGFAGLTARLKKKAEDEFVAKINGLHESADAVRFRSIQPLTAEELYYVAVMTNGLIYTSSYTSGVYPLMMRKAGNRGDELLKKLNFDHYRRFISQAAAYNTLKNFLSTFKNKEDAHALMSAFVTGIEKSDGLEDGVDVADSYASIYETQPDVAAQMLANVKENYDRSVAEHNRRGIAIYNILYKLFLSADSSNNINLTQELGIPPVYSVSNESLKNPNGDIIVQVFFYGDKDGKGIFNGFVNMFGDGNWAADYSNKQWVTIKSKKGQPVTIYANRALPEETGEDDKAQRALCSYLEDNNLQPSITIHRGHSYYAPTTIDYMAPSSKIVFMGSCGGFNLIDSILQKSQDAHIIASKQIGKTAINKPFFSLLTEDLRKGQDIDWLPFWKEFRRRANISGFEDYVPPYKNLGAIFIKAYKKETGDEDS